MSKKKAEQTANLYEEISKELSGNLLGELEDVKDFIDTGNLAINYSCSGKFITGGVPSNKIIEAFGPHASGKSLIGSNLISAAQRKGYWVVLIDMEDAANPEFMQKVSKVDPSKVFRLKPVSLEQSFIKIHSTVKKIRELEKAKSLAKRPFLFIYDSIAVASIERELRENDLEEDFTDADFKRIVGAKSQPGERAKILGAKLRGLLPLLEKENVTLYMINQVRDKIGVLYGNPETTTSGHAIPFFSSCRFRTSTAKKIEDKDTKKFSGINMQVDNKKNRSFRPFVKVTDVRLYFSHGIDPLSGGLDVLLQDGRITLKSPGNWIVNKDWLPEDKEEYKFKANKVENRIPKEVILDCPKLVDAKTKQEVEEYLSAWSTGLEATESDAYTEGEEIVDSLDV